MTTRRLRLSVLAAAAAIVFGTGCFGGDKSPKTTNVTESAEFDDYSADLSTAATPSNIVLFGDKTFAINDLAAFLESLGLNVTVPNDFRLPANLTGFHTAWHVGQVVPLTEAEIERLVNFLNAGGGVFLTGESDAIGMNASLNAVVQQAVVDSGGITVGFPTTVFGFTGGEIYFVNQDAAGGVADTPNQAEFLRLPGAAGITGLSPTSPNVIATGGFFGVEQPVAAIWTEDDLVGGSGALAVVMDGDWLIRRDDEDNASLLENLQEGLRGVVNTPPREVEAGEDIQVTCDSDEELETIPVTLNGSAIDDDGDELTFTWYEFGEPIATGPNPTVEFTLGTHFVVLEVSDGRTEVFDDLVVVAECEVACEPGPGLFTRCHPGCPCDHGEGDCDVEADCLPGLVCLHDAGFAFGYKDNEVDVCSNKCPDLGVGAWNYCSPDCPCDIGQGDCEIDSDCLPGLRCVSDIGPAFGFDREVDVCEPI